MISNLACAQLFCLSDLHGWDVVNRYFVASLRIRLFNLFTVCCVATQLPPHLWSTCGSCGWYDMHLRLVCSVALHGWRQRYPQSLISCTLYAFIGFCVGLCDAAVGNSLPHVLDLMDAVRHGLLCMWMVGLGLSALVRSVPLVCHMMWLCLVWLGWTFRRNGFETPSGICIGYMLGSLTCPSVD